MDISFERLENTNKTIIPELHNQISNEDILLYTIHDIIN